MELKAQKDLLKDNIPTEYLEIPIPKKDLQQVNSEEELI
jgi:hypothetical protein